MSGGEGEVGGGYSVSLGTDPLQANHNPAIFLPPGTVKLSKSPR